MVALTRKWFWYCLLLAAVTVSLTSSLEMSINESFHPKQENDAGQQDIDACDFTNGGLDRAPSLYCYCDPDGDNVIKANCFLHRDPSTKDWNAVSRLHTVTYFDIGNRAYVMKELPPPNVFTGMKSLHYFTVKMAEIHSIRSFAFGNSSSLAEIDMANNNVQYLSPNSFSNLVNITKIKLHDNNLTEINRNVFVNLPKLHELLLMKNGIQTVHDNALQDLKKLNDLSLRDNRVSVITREVFYGLQKMKNLDLHGNVIEYIGDHVFAEMPHLEDLDLSKNMIKSVSPTAFAGLTKLGRLNLRDNKIVKLQPSTFNHFRLIFFLDLQNNELETLSEAVVAPIYSNLKNSNMQLYLEGNRFMCDCRIRWIKNLYSETDSLYTQQHISRMTCNLFEPTSKQNAIVASPSAAIFQTDTSASAIKILTGPPEETTTYVYESEKSILNLTETDLTCHDSHSEVDESHDKTHGRRHDGNDGHRHTLHNATYSVNHHHHKQKVNQNAEPVFEKNPRNKFLHPTELDISESHHHDHHAGNTFSDENTSTNPGVHRHLNEPQATAALEGADVSGNAPKRTSSGDPKVDTSRISSNLPDNSSGAYIFNCDFRLFLMGIVSICMTLIPNM